MSRIRELRQRRGLTQEELARLLGVSRITVRRWDKDEATPQRRLRVTLARRLGVRVDELGLEDSHNP